MSLKRLSLSAFFMVAALAMAQPAWATISQSPNLTGEGDSYAPTPIIQAPAVLAPLPSTTASPPGLPEELQIVIPPEPVASGTTSAAAQQAALAEGEDVELYSYLHWSGTSYRQRNFSTRVIRDKNEWMAFWDYAKIRPPVDFPAGQMAVVIILGQRPHDGFSVRVSSIRRTDDNFLVYYVENKVARSRASGTQVVPWVVQMLPKTQGRVRFMQLETGQ